MPGYVASITLPPAACAVFQPPSSIEPSMITTTFQSLKSPSRGVTSPAADAVVDAAPPLVAVVAEAAAVVSDAAAVVSDELSSPPQAAATNDAATSRPASRVVSRTRPWREERMGACKELRMTNPFPGDEWAGNGVAIDDQVGAGWRYTYVSS